MTAAALPPNLTPPPTLAELTVVHVADPTNEPWMGCESVHPMTWVPGFEAAAEGDRSRRSLYAPG